jgi:replicative DNA helicase
MNLYEIESELVLIASLFRDLRRIPRVCKVLSEDDFSDMGKCLFSTLKNTKHSGTKIDMVQFRYEYNKKYPPMTEDMFKDLADKSSSAANVNYHTGVVAEASRRRKLLIMCDHIKSSLEVGSHAVDVLSDARKTMLSVSSSDKNDIIHISEGVKRAHKHIEQTAENGGKLSGYNTGLYKLNKLTNGIKPGKFYVIGARPSMGKSILGSMIAEHSGANTTIFNFEMGIEEQASRSISARGQVDYGRIQSGKLRDDDWDAMTNTCNELAALPIHYVENVNLNINQIVAYIETMHIDGKADLVVLDYLQLINPDRSIQSREQQVADISRKLKILALDLNIPVVVLSQLNRQVDERPTHKPQMSDLRESGSLEQDADVVIFIKRDAVYNLTDDNEFEADIYVPKNRGNETGFFKAEFQGKYQRFNDIIKED